MLTYKKPAGIEAEDTEEEDNDVNQQYDTACLIGKRHYIHHQNDGGIHLDNCQAGICHFHIQTRAEEYIQDNIDDGRADPHPNESFPFKETGKIGKITKNRGNDVSGRCHEKTPDAQCLFWIIFGDNGKQDSIDKKISFHILNI